MKYTTQIVINQPLKTVISLFDNPENLKLWQPGFISMEHLSGEHGQEGSKYLMKYKMGSRNVEMIETIIKRELPHRFDASYETKGVYNLVSNQFIAEEENKTVWISDNEFRFTGFMSIMAFFMKGAFRKQTSKYQVLFKKFAETR